MEREVSVMGLELTVFRNVECSWAVEVGVGVLVINECPVPLSGNSRSAFAFVVSIEPESNGGAKTFVVRPFERVVVKVYIGPIVTDGGL